MILFWTTHVGLVVSWVLENVVGLPRFLDQGHFASRKCLEFLLLRGSVPTESSKEPVVASLENYVLLLLGTMGLEKVLQIDDSIRKRLHCDRPFCVPGFLVLSSLV